MNTDHTGSGGARLRVLIPLDGSELAGEALPVAADLCHALSGELHIVTALPPVIAPFVVNGSYIPTDVFQQLIDDQERNASEFMAHARADASARGLEGRVITHTLHGDAAVTLLDAIDTILPALVVMTTHGRTGLARFALGSMADKVVRSGVAPVLLLHSFATSTPERQGKTPAAVRPTAPQAEPAAHPRLTHALAPLDGTKASEAPLFSLALQLAGPVLHTITLLRVVDPRDGNQGRVEAEAYLADARERLIKAIAGHDCVVTTRVEVNRSPADAILACAPTAGCDLVIIATRSEAGIGRLAFGSVADHVLHDGQSPLLLIHPPRHQR